MKFQTLQDRNLVDKFNYLCICKIVYYTDKCNHSATLYNVPPLLPMYAPAETIPGEIACRCDSISIDVIFTVSYEEDQDLDSTETDAGIIDPIYTI